MFYEIKGTFKFPDLPTEQLVDVFIYYSKKMLLPYTYEKERPVFKASDIEKVSISIIGELSLVENELTKVRSKKTIKDFPYMNAKFSFYLEKNHAHLDNKIFAEFLEDEKNKLIFTLSLFSYKNYPTYLDDIFRAHVFEFKFISYLTTYFYYESVRFDKKLRSISEKEAIVLDSPVNEGISMKDTIASFEQSPSVKNTVNNIDEIFQNEMLSHSFKMLTPHQRSILFLYYVEGYKDLEIAKKIGVSQQAVSKSKKSAISKLKNLMKGDG